MLSAVRFLPPIIIPSWRFFRAIEPSPRIEWAVTNGARADWRDIHLRPSQLSIPAMLRRLIWNPDWNAALFLTTCAERIQEQPTEHAVAEIRRRVLRRVEAEGLAPAGAQLMFRLVFVHGVGAARREELVFLSDPFPVGDPS